MVEFISPIIITIKEHICASPTSDLSTRKRRRKETYTGLHHNKAGNEQQSAGKSTTENITRGHPRSSSIIEKNSGSCPRQVISSRTTIPILSLIQTSAQAHWQRRKEGGRNTKGQTRNLQKHLDSSSTISNNRQPNLHKQLCCPMKGSTTTSCAERANSQEKNRRPPEAKQGKTMTSPRHQ